MTLDLNERMQNLLDERDSKKKAEAQAHADVIALNRKITKLQGVIEDAKEVLGETQPTETVKLN